MPTALQKLNVLPLGMCVVLMPNIGVNTSIFNTTQIRPQHFRNFMCGNVLGASTKYWSENHHIEQYKNTPTVLQKLHACILGICVVLVPNIGISTSVSNTIHKYAHSISVHMHRHMYTHALIHTHMYTHTLIHTHIYTTTQLIYAHTHTHNSLQRSVRYTKFTCISYTIRVPPFSLSKVHKCTT